METSPLLVGRQKETDALGGTLDAVRAGSGRTVVLAGEAGIGKTRLADWLASTARDRGTPVLWGRCWEAGGAPAYWPWLQALRAFVAEADLNDLRAALGIGAPYVARIIPEIRDRLPDVPELPIDDSDAARFQVFVAASAFVRALAAANGLVLILEDLHAADEPSLLLLQFIAADIRESRVLILATYRDEDIVPGSSRGDLLTSLSRAPSATRLAPTRLGEADVAQYLAMSAQSMPAVGLADAISRETEGNPLFVVEMIRLLDAEGRIGSPARPDGSLGVPEGVRSVIGKRLARLSPACRDLLSRGSVIGVDLQLDLLARVEDSEPDTLLELLDEAATARVLIGPTGPDARWRFTHSLIREVLYLGLPAAARRRLHLRIAEVLESIHDGDRVPPLAELAHHFLAGGGGAKAVEYAELAAERASRVYGHEEAVRLYRLALGVDGLGEPRRCHLLLGLGEAAIRAGDQATAREAFLAAAEIADELGLLEDLARAAIGYGGRFVWRRAGDDERLVPLLERALRKLDPTDVRDRVRLQARLAGALRDEPDMTRRADLSAQALADARELGDPSSLVGALMSRYAAILGPDALQEMEALTAEAVAVASAAGNDELIADSQLNGLLLANSSGDGELIREEVANGERLARELRQPSNLWFLGVQRTNLALLEARLDDAETLLAETRQLGSRGQAWDSEYAHLIGLFLLRREQGRLSEVTASIRSGVGAYPGYRLLSCVAVFVDASLGRTSAARRGLDRVANDDFRFLPRDWGWLFGMMFLAEAALILEDHGRAAQIERLLEPYTGMFATGSGDFSAGPVDRIVGLLAAAAGRADEGLARLDRAVEACRGMGTSLYLTRLAVNRATILARRDQPGDRDQARDIATSVLETCEALGLVEIGAEAKAVVALLAEPGPAAADPRPEPAGGARRWTFVREGEYWAIGAGPSIRLRDAKGLRYLADLLASPGREFHVLDLVGRRAPGAEVRENGSAREAGLHPAAERPLDAGIDAVAKAAYRDRIRELGAEIDEAEAFNDPERAARAQSELETLESEIRSAFGLGGHARDGRSAAERARQSVTKAIRESLLRIAALDPTLGAHLVRTVRTGIYCAYDPDPSAPVDWLL